MLRLSPHLVCGINPKKRRIAIFLFGGNLFVGIVISIGITIPLRRGIPIPLKNKRNTCSLRNRMHFPKEKKKKKKHIIFHFISNMKKKRWVTEGGRTKVAHPCTHLAPFFFFFFGYSRVELW
jgi:hypothetical protein